MINLQNTGKATADAIKLLVYGAAGVRQNKLNPNDAKADYLVRRSWVLSIASADLPFLAIKSMDDLREAYSWLTTSDDAKGYKSIALDSISEIAEVCLESEKAKAKDPRQAFGEMATTMAQVIRMFRDIPDRHVLFTAKLDKSQDETGRMLYAPSMPGNKTGQALPYYFDIVAALRVEKDADGNAQRALMCDTDGLWQAKDRSGKTRRLRGT